MDRKIALVVGRTVGRVLALDWRDKGGGLVKFIRMRILLDTKRPLRRVACLVDKEEREITYVLKYEWLPTFCYICRLVDNGTTKCDHFSKENDPAMYQYGRWIRVQPLLPRQLGRMCNSVELISKDVGQEDIGNQVSSEGRKEMVPQPYGKSSKEASVSCSPANK